MKAQRYIPLYTVEDYNRWEGQWELIYGTPHDMSPSPRRRHQQLGSLVLTQLSIEVGELPSCDSCRVYYELDWHIDQETIVRPDIMVVCGEFKDDFLHFPPTLIVEILSPNTAMKDRTVKFELYENQQVPHYIMLDPDDGSVRIFRLQDKVYVETPSDSFALVRDCSVRIDFGALMKMLD